MSASAKKAPGTWRHDPELVLLWGAIVMIATVVGVVAGAAHLGAALSASSGEIPANPFALLFGLLEGSVTWPPAATGALIALVVALTTAAGGALVVVRRYRGRRSRVDRAARHMGRRGDVGALTRRGATQTAQRLGVPSPGLPIAQAIATGQVLYASWEDVCIDIWGPRTGKTTSRAIPAILEAPGAVIVTSNKRDVVDATRGIRAQLTELWVFDPQGIVDEPVTWWWNPLTYVTDEVKASILADVFAAGSRDPGARTDAYFEPAAQDLLANLLLAAARAHRPLTQVYEWLADPTDDEAVHILQREDFSLLAAAVQAVVSAPEKQRAGVYGTAQQIASFMTNRQAMRWVTPPDHAGTAEFSPEAFVAGSGTLYSLSKEGRGSAGPLVTALTVAVTEAAEARAKRSPQGRLPVPMVAVLDEAANVCRWRELPNLYSHYGSRGICVMTILQSWSQGVEVWGREGMRKLWSAANIKVYGGGVAEVEFLGELSQLVGDFDLHTVSISHGKGGRSTSRSTRREKVLEVSELSALPRGRAVVFASGAPPTLVRTLPWMDGPHAAAVRASIQAHDPTGVQESARPRRWQEEPA